MLRHLQWPFTWAVSNTWLRTSSTGLLTVISILDGCLIPFQQVSRTPISQWVFDAASWGLAVLYMLYCARWAMLYCARWATSGFVIDQRRRKKESMWDLICEYIQWLSPYFALYIYIVNRWKAMPYSYYLTPSTLATCRPFQSKKHRLRALFFTSLREQSNPSQGPLPSSTRARPNQKSIG